MTTMKLASLLTALAIAGCATAPALDASRLPATPAHFKEGGQPAAAPEEARPQGPWWKAFADPVLDDLVARAGDGNASLQVAAARLAQARAAAGAAGAALSPQLGLHAGASRVGGIVDGAPSPAGTRATAGAALSYEVDLWGKLARASDAAALDARSREGLLEATRLLVQAEVAQAYLAIRALDAERGLVEGTLAANRETLAITEGRFRAGDVAELDVARARAEVAATESEALALDRRRAALENALAVLVGESASGFALAPAEWTTRLPAIPAGIPATVLARRPDVSAARDALLAARQRVGVAQAAWFPDVALTADGGYASAGLSDLLKWSARAWGVGALLSLPVLDGGRREAGVQDATARLDEAIARYREQVLVSLREVEDQLAALRLLASQSQAQARAVDAAARATDLSNARYLGGFVSQLELLDARRIELGNRRQALQVRAAQYQSTVGLVRALGGGWGGA